MLTVVNYKEGRRLKENKRGLESYCYTRRKYRNWHGKEDLFE